MSWSDERCWHHGYELDYCPCLNGDEPFPAPEWESWVCPHCNRDVDDHREDSHCAEIPADYLARPWSETQGNIEQFRHSSLSRPTGHEVAEVVSRWEPMPETSPNLSPELQEALRQEGLELGELGALLVESDYEHGDQVSFFIHPRFMENSPIIHLSHEDEEKLMHWLFKRYAFRSVVSGAGAKEVTLQNVTLGRAAPGSKKIEVYIPPGEMRS